MYVCPTCSASETTWLAGMNKGCIPPSLSTGITCVREIYLVPKLFFFMFLRASPTDMRRSLTFAQMSGFPMIGQPDYDSPALLLPTPFSLIFSCPTRLSSIATSREQRNIAQRRATLTCLLLAEFDLPWSHSLWWLLPTVGEREDDILIIITQNICSAEQPAWS